MRTSLRTPAASVAHARDRNGEAMLLHFFGWATEPYIRASIATDIAEHVWKPELRDPVEVWREIQRMRRDEQRRWCDRTTARLTQVIEADAPTLVDENRTVKLELVEV